MKGGAFVTTRQAARLLNVSLRTIQLWSESGILSAWKTAGGHRRISRESVERMRYEQDRAIGGAVANNGSIVIVEDDPLYLELYQLKIATWRLPVVVSTASNGFEGLLLIGKLSPQIVITDLGMPGMDGFEMIRSLQENSTKLEVIVITGLNDAEIKRLGGLPKGVTLMRKPPPMGELEELLRGRVAKLERA